MSDTPYRIELIVYPDRTIEFKGDAFEIEVAKEILLSDQRRELAGKVRQWGKGLESVPWEEDVDEFADSLLKDPK